MLDPLYILKIFLKEMVEVRMKDGEVHSGILQGFDEHISIVVSLTSVNNREEPILLLRGEDILSIGKCTSEVSGVVPEMECY
ncbi:LSM domain-containing protein [Ordospora colligata]|uniref:LSM domain-containing protein n=1 Tax=Ordospora colligata OC4 TaxID=1354746 RepID=A0A0B2UIU2_9MICR|nr:LSM domain-containing protein [Ordospora colligata OC4]KHN68972.1 LSM domain-containing protein [Ordospora colligata OC4]TBU14006.1 LSM domain-containing protein [Ordospora colligata]TBU14195.1 LSM domain-containing protein [Ordospora colligata]TBU17864.1 LSM domain-containing protein [Ordospora colligata]